MLHGVGAPKFVYDPEGENEEEVLLDWVNILENEPELRVLMHEGEIDGDRNFLWRGKHRRIEIMMHLFKYDLDPESGFTAKEKYEQIKQYEGSSKIAFYLHRDAPPYQTADSTPVYIPFILESVEEQWLDTLDFADTLLLVFRSTKFVNPKNNLKTPPSADDVFIDNPINTEDVL